MRPATRAPALRWAVLLRGAGQVVWIGLFFVNMWPRIRPVGSQAREAKGEKFRALPNVPGGRRSGCQNGGPDGYVR